MWALGAASSSDSGSRARRTLHIYGRMQRYRTGSGEDLREVAPLRTRTRTIHQAECMR